MSISIELLDRLKAAQGNASDYRAAKLLGVGQPTICKYRNGELNLSPEKVIIACELADLNASEWLMRLQLERAKCAKEKAIWNDLLQRVIH